MKLVDFESKSREGHQRLSRINSDVSRYTSDTQRSQSYMEPTISTPRLFPDGPQSPNDTNSVPRGHSRATMHSLSLGNMSFNMTELIEKMANQEEQII